MNENRELFSKKNKKVIGKIKIQTSKTIWIVEFLFLRSKSYTFKCESVNKNKLIGISKSQSKHIKFGEYKNV